MKKVISILLIIFSLVLVGCTNADVGINQEDILPFSFEGALCTEQASYRYIRYLGSDEAAEPVVITTEDSYVTYTLKEGKSLSIEGEIIKGEINDPSSTLLETEIFVKYLDVEGMPQIHRDLIDTPERITAKTVFNRYTMAARFTYREVLVHQAVGDDLCHVMLADYTGDFLGSKKARFRDISTGGITELPIEGSSYFDNESIFYLTRSLKSVAEGGSQAFDYANPYDDYVYYNSTGKNKKITARALEQATESSLEKIKVGEDVSQLSPLLYDKLYLDTDNLTSEEKDNLYLDCLKTTLRLGDKKSGQPVTLYFAAQKIRFTSSDFSYPSEYNASKVLIKIKQPLYSGANLSTTQVYVLKDYSNSKTAISQV